MKPFTFYQPESIEAILQTANDSSQYLAGGTNQMDLMKKHIYLPKDIIAIKSALSKTIDSKSEGVTLGAAATNSAVANNEIILKSYPLISRAILAGASPQIRNMATTSGNLLQRTRCPYFYDTVSPCNKRKPNSGCSALRGHQRMAGIIGTSEHCVAVHPSDFCVSLVALDASVHLTDVKGNETTIAFEKFHRLPESNPERDTNLPPNAIITSVFIPKNNFEKHSAYVKIRERDSYAFALVSVAAMLELNNNIIKEARLASGGVAHKPWRWHNAEAFLQNKPANRSTFEAVAELIASETQPLAHNSFKVNLLKGAVVSALLECVSNPSNS